MQKQKTKELKGEKGEKRNRNENQFHIYVEGHE